jgi:response regulator RpfG family c-di-GMP phosphodiesterase
MADLAAAENASDDLLFADENTDEDALAVRRNPPWRILIVDDDHEVHAITRVVLGDASFEKRPLRFLSAYSAKQARALLDEHRDIAVILLDVVMETDDAGLTLVRHIRETLGNRQVRIILRTGQPGQAPERAIIAAYDINDYKAKSELTAQKLFTATVAALRSYQHISLIERGRQGVEAVMEAADHLLEQPSRAAFLRALTERMADLLPISGSVLLCAASPDGEPRVLSAASAGDGPLDAPLPDEVMRDMRATLADGRSRWGDRHGVARLRSRSQAPHALCVLADASLPEVEQRLIELFCAKAGTGFDNLHLVERLQEAQIATVHALGKLAEYKDEVTGDHVKRLGRWATAIAHELRARDQFPDELDEEFCGMIGLASVLHDVGKVAIPDAILRKPGRLDPEEMRHMREHAAIGGAILRDAGGEGPRNCLSMGAQIAESHHERFDGGGYPHGLSGDAIPLSGRIVAVADVFDALLHRRPYKKAWEMEEVLDLLRAESGRHFDPRVIDAFLAVLARDGLPLVA